MKKGKINKVAAKWNQHLAEAAVAGPGEVSVMSQRADFQKLDQSE